MRFADFECVFLPGNHESADAGLPARRAIHGLDVWLDVGGEATLDSYLGEDWRRRNLDVVQRRLRKNLHDAGHWGPLMDMMRRLFFVVGDFFFCHACPAPLISIDLQKSRLIHGTPGTYDGPFKVEGRFESMTLVHGHYVRRQVDAEFLRVGLDVDAWRTGYLPVLRLEGEDKWLV